MKLEISIISLFLIVVLASSGCITTGEITSKSEIPSNTESGPTCNIPYIVKGYDCCLDENDNKICDTDERRNIPIPNEVSEVTPFIVSKVSDGDTITLITGERVRLLGINTPEMGQPYYDDATNRLKELIEGKEVRLEKDVIDKDQYGRLLRHVFVKNENINEKMLREGLATLYVISPNVKYKSEFADAETYAKQLKIGLWSPPKSNNGANQNICDDKCIGVSYFKWNAEGNDCENLNGEYVTFINTCPHSCAMAGWTVKDESSRSPYTFSGNFILNSQSTVTLYTGCGVNSETDLYWCSSGKECNSIWNNNGGDTLYLRNREGQLVLSHHYEGY